jgi:hypothetical protein
MLIIVQVHDKYFYSSFFKKYEFLKSDMIPYKFSVSSFKMIIILNHNQFLFFYIFMLSCIINYKFS